MKTKIFLIIVMLCMLPIVYAMDDQLFITYVGDEQTYITQQTGDIELGNIFISGLADYLNILFGGNVIITYTQGFETQFTIVGTNPVDTYSINWTDFFFINNTGWLGNSSPSIAAGSYIVNVSVNDTVGLYNSTVIQITINKASPPIALSFTPSSVIEEFTTSIVAGINCPLQLTCNLTRQSVYVVNPDINNFTIGTYYYIYNTSGNANYTSSSVISSLIINYRHLLYVAYTVIGAGIRINLFIIFLTLGVILLALGFFRQEHIEMALMGFFILFLLGTIVLTGNITTQLGENISTTYTYDASWNATSSLDTNTYYYNNIEMNDASKKYFGLWLMISSMIGFAGVLFGMKKQGWMNGRI